MKFKKICKRLFIVALLVYVVCIFIKQQKTINSYASAENYYAEQINKKVAYRESLYDKKNNLNSEEYIEETAREKLDMYLPNERVFIDTSK